MKSTGGFLIIGPPITGKTRSLGTLPGRTILFNWELEGYLALRVPYVVCKSLRDFWKEGRELKQTTPGVRPTEVIVVDYLVRPGSISEMKEVQLDRNHFLNFIKDANSLPEHLEEFDYIGADSLGPFATEALDFIIALNGRNTPQIQDYRDAIKKIMEVLFRIQGLGKPLIMLAHFQTERDEISGKGRQVPQVWGKDLPQNVLKWFSTILQSIAIPDGKGGTSYLWKTKPEGLVESLGGRPPFADNLPATIPQDFKALFERIPK